MNKAQKVTDPEVMKSLLSNERTLDMIADAMRKATVTSDTYEFSPTDRSVFVAENLDPVIKLIVPTATPVRSLLPRKTGRGQATAWKRMTSKLDPTTTGQGIEFADGGTPNETSHTFDVVTAAYKLLGRKLSVGLQHIASSRDSVPVEDELLRIKTLEVMLGEENMIINGDSSETATQFDGLVKQITTVSGAETDLTADIVAGYDKSIWENGGMATHLFLSATQSKKLADELQETGSIQRISIDNQGAATANLRVTQIVSPVTGNLIKLVTSRFMGSNAILGTMKSEAGENYVEMEDLIPLVKMDVPVTTFAKDSFVVESTVLKLIAEPYWAKITGLNT